LRRSPATALTRLALALGAALLAAAKLWAGVTGDLAATMAKAGDDPWGLVSLAVLYGGLIMTAGLIWLIEPRRGISLGVIAALPLVGNMAAALWLVWRGLDLISRRSARP
jgi:hypothetical protein